jgi:hypothetical protein
LQAGGRRFDPGHVHHILVGMPVGNATSMFTVRLPAIDPLFWSSCVLRDASRATPLMRTEAVGQNNRTMVLAIPSYMVVRASR